MNTAKNMASSAVSTIANIPVVSENLDKTFNMPGLTKQASEYLQFKLQPTAPPLQAPAPKAEDKWPLPLKVLGVIGACVALYFALAPRTPKVGRGLLSAEDEEKEPYGGKIRSPWLIAIAAAAIVVLSIRYVTLFHPLRSWFAKMWTGSPARSRGTLSSRRSYYPPRSCRYQLRTK